MKQLLQSSTVRVISNMTLDRVDSLSCNYQAKGKPLLTIYLTMRARQRYGRFQVTQKSVHVTEPKTQGVNVVFDLIIQKHPKEDTNDRLHLRRKHKDYLLYDPEDEIFLFLEQSHVGYPEYHDLILQEIHSLIELIQRRGKILP
jgi:hypothetical protein